jgi:K+ transporter
MELASGNSHTANKFSALGLLVTLGIVFGDIGTSPLYVMKTILHANSGYGAGLHHWSCGRALYGRLHSKQQ